jgi:hypothetical protein
LFSGKEKIRKIATCVITQMAIEKQYIKYISEKSILSYMELADGLGYVQEVVSNTLHI